MIEITGNIWDFKSPTTPICITTNGFTKKNGECVMGRGIALQAKQRYPQLPFLLGERLKQMGNRVYYFPELDIITFPTKHNWFENSDPSLIHKSACELYHMCTNDYINTADSYGWEKVYLVRPGCSNGKLDWQDVKPIIEPILIGDNFVVVQN